MRLFIAVCFDDETKNRLCDTTTKLNLQLKRGKFTDRDNLHLTLVFIGETTRVAEIRGAMDNVSAKEFDLIFGGLGSFRRDRDFIFWIGVEKSKTLYSIHRQLSEGLKSAGFSIEARPYKPHLTLCREALPEESYDGDAFSRTVPDIKMRVSKISLMKSERINGRLVYKAIYEKKLFSPEA